MGFWQEFVFGEQVAQTPTLLAADTYYNSVNTLWAFDTSTPVTVTRQEAMSVPAVARARNIICSTVGSLPLQQYSAITGRELETQSPLLYQPDLDSPKSVTYAWLADSILFYGVGYLIVTEVESDGRPRHWRWLDPARVSPQLNGDNTIIIGYQVDGAAAPQTGVGSIIAFNGMDEGLLRRAARTIKTAVELENAAYRSAQEPVPQTVLQSTGVDLPDDKVSSVLTKWKTARQTRSTAYLYSGLKMETVGFDPKSQQLVEARQFHASEIARAAGIPAWYLNAEMASMTYSNTEQERRTLIDFSLRPILSAIEDRMSMYDITPRATKVAFDIDDFLRGSMNERAQIATTLFSSGIIDEVEARYIVDLDPREGNGTSV